MKKQTDYYTYQVTLSEEDQEYVGSCLEFPSLSHLARTQSSALKGIIKLIDDIVEDMKNNHEPIPEPIAEKRYSGKFQVRIPPDRHRLLAIKDLLSLNPGRRFACPGLATCRLSA